MFDLDGIRYTRGCPYPHKFLGNWREWTCPRCQSQVHQRAVCQVCQMDPRRDMHLAERGIWLDGAADRETQAQRDGTAEGPAWVQGRAARFLAEGAEGKKRRREERPRERHPKPLSQSRTGGSRPAQEVGGSRVEEVGEAADLPPPNP